MFWPYNAGMKEIKSVLTEFVRIYVCPSRIWKCILALTFAPFFLTFFRCAILRNFVDAWIDFRILLWISLSFSCHDLKKPKNTVSFICNFWNSTPPITYQHVTNFLIHVIWSLPELSRFESARKITFQYFELTNIL